MSSKSDSQPSRRPTDASRCFMRLSSFLSSGSAPKPEYQDALDLYLSTKHPRNMSDFEAQSFSIIRSNELWDEFREEARAKQITTALGLREMLKEKYVRRCQKQTECKEDIVRPQRSISWRIDDDEVDNDILEAMQTLAPCQESYRHRIRGDTEGIMSLYVNDSEKNRKGTSSVRVARIDSKHSLSAPCIRPNQERRTARRGSKSWIGTLTDSDCSPVVETLGRSSDSKSTIDYKRKVSFGSTNKDSFTDESIMLVSRQGDDMLSHCSTHTFSTKRNSTSADDLSSQYSDGSTLLVEWGECGESSDGETNGDIKDLSPALSGLVLNVEPRDAVSDLMHLEER
ncbi:hypothetical protein HJC23_013644 [Cyclotella cryptica]|uniref:MADF domain-containing protein n=1 Tax=Cyclotella cryptica TaxID=29204 RepID=A0ABD3QV21_9STRA|eukprot:CCRYP_001463-RA/>CCRYP_001463-RA protein AED:0.41 eAED:0.41 QI:0/-1/0/1/-1/1/1/0/341